MKLSCCWAEKQTDATALQSLPTTPINYMFDTRRTHQIRLQRSRVKENSINPHATGETQQYVWKTLRVHIFGGWVMRNTPRKMKTKISLFNIHFVCTAQQHCYGYGYKLAGMYIFASSISPEYSNYIQKQIILCRWFLYDIAALVVSFHLDLLKINI